MPYEVDSPPDRVKGLPKHAQEIWIEAYNNALKQYKGDEKLANQTAWSAVTKAGYKKSGDTWIKAAEKINPNDWIEVFKAGKYPQGEFTAKDIDEIIENFDPSYHEPPFVPDHKEEGPAWGWTAALKRVGDSLWAKIRDITKEAKQRIENGEYRKISVAIYDNFENTGKKALKHIAALGAGIPAVKGMQTFSDIHGNFVKIIEQEDIDNFQTQDKKDIDNKGGFDMDEKQFNELLSKKLKEAENGFTAKVKELQDGFETKFKTLEDENKKLTESLAESTKQLTLQEEKALETEIHAFCENLKSKGQLPPVYQDRGVEKALKEMALMKMDAMKFSKAEDAKEVNLYQWFREFLQENYKVVEFKEIVKDEGDKNKVESQFFEVGDESKKLEIRNQEMAQEAAILMKEEKISYADALLKISKRNDRR